MRVLLLEDDPRLCETYARRLRSDGHAVDKVGTLGGARDLMMDVSYDCFVLDRLVPDGDSLDLVADIATHKKHPPILILSALSDSEQRVRGLAAGADDYVAKPVRLEELAVRVRKLIVRSTPGTRPPVHLGRVVVDRDRCYVTLDGEPVNLTPHQYKVFDLLVSNRDQIVTTRDLLDTCWEHDTRRFVNPLHVHISRLRRAFDGALRFHSVRSRGYMLQVIPQPARTPRS